MDSPTIASPKEEQAEEPAGNYTFFDSTNSGSRLSPTKVSSSNSDEQLLQTEKLLSCLSLQKLGYEDGYANDNCDDWNEGWDIPTATVEEAIREDGGLNRVSTPKIPLIGEQEFKYYPAPNIDHGKEDDDKSLKFARIKLVKMRGARGGSDLGFRTWVRKFRWGG